MCDKLKNLLKRGDISPELKIELEKCIEDIDRKNAKRKETEKQNSKEITFLKQEIIEKDKFFSIIAHDLRGPLGHFIGLSDFLISDLELMSIKELQELAKNLDKSAKNVFELLENLLEWSRTRTGQLVSNPVEINLRDELLKVSSLYSASAIAKEIALHSNDLDVMINYDRHMLQAVLRNLINNSIKYCMKGDTVTVSSQRVDGFIEVSVSDTGIGMSKEILSGLFRIDSNVKREGTAHEPSTGLGLLLCKEFVELNGGKIWAESAKGMGSKFIFTIPASLN